jgi:CHASE3 domain sensor protein
MHLPRIHRTFKDNKTTKAYMKPQRISITLRILLMPLLAIVFLIGFIASFYGEKKENQQIRNQTVTKQIVHQTYDLEIRVIPQEEQTIKTQ